VSIASPVVRRVDEAGNQPGREQGDDTMRFMMLVKADASSEAGVLPDEKSLADMAKYNETLIKAGVLLAGEGLHASSSGARVSFRSGKPAVVDGPFSEAKELVAGFWMIQVKSREEAIEWAKRVPFVDGEIEIRKVFELSDFPQSDAVQQHAELRQQFEQR
jgi:hypothetical protein